ncbi:alpha-galactosidase A [Biscogniauxia marginata]|nr:alpha-galactosidase A [Biscogniauxia marginata]
MVVIPGDNTTNPPMQPIILSMESNISSSLPEPLTEIPFHPPFHPPRLPYNEEWTVAYISCDKVNGDLKTSILNRTLASLTAMVFEAVSHSILLTTLLLLATIIAKTARFEWELPHIEQETRAYQLLEGSRLAPRFLAHVHENGRIVGVLLEKIEGRCGKLHNLGLVHGDVNRYNFFVAEGGMKLLDFERLWRNASPKSLSKELENLHAELVDESGRGRGFIFYGDID